MKRKNVASFQVWICYLKFTGFLLSAKFMPSTLYALSNWVFSTCCEIILLLWFNMQGNWVLKKYETCTNLHN